MELFFLREFGGMGLWAVDRVHGARLTGLRNPHQMWAVHSQMDARD
jgi:hypothetical protein